MGHSNVYFSKSDEVIPASELTAMVDDYNDDHELEAPDRLEVSVDGPDNAWTEIVIGGGAGTALWALMKLCRYELHPEQPDSSERAELLDAYGDIGWDGLPKSNFAWIRTYMQHSKYVYRVDLYSPAFDDGTDDLVARILDSMFCENDCLWHEDFEGWGRMGYRLTHEEGLNSGTHTFALVDGTTWRHFKMDVKDTTQLAQFHEGKLPAGIANIAQMEWPADEA